MGARECLRRCRAGDVERLRAELDDRFNRLKATLAFQETVGKHSAYYWEPPTLPHASVSAVVSNTADLLLNPGGILQLLYMGSTPMCLFGRDADTEPVAAHAAMEASSHHAHWALLLDKVKTHGGFP